MYKLSLILLALLLLVQGSSAEKRTDACKTPDIAPTYVTIHGRLQYGNGTRALRLWHVGTNHKFGIYSGLYAKERDPLDSEHPQLPGELQKLFDGPDLYEPIIFADFQVCPLEPYIAGHMQAACIESATHITAKR